MSGRRLKRCRISKIPFIAVLRRMPLWVWRAVNRLRHLPPFVWRVLWALIVLIVTHRLLLLLLWNRLTHQG